MIPKSCRLFGQDRATEQMLRAKSRFNLKRFRSKESKLTGSICRGHGALLLPACNRTQVHQSAVHLSSSRSRIDPTSAEKAGMRGLSASLSLPKRPLTEPRSGFRSVGVVLSAQAERGKSYATLSARLKPHRQALLISINCKVAADEPAAATRQDTTNKGATKKDLDLTPPRSQAGSDAARSPCRPRQIPPPSPPSGNSRVRARPRSSSAVGQYDGRRFR
jgi:hypothetical protein